VDYHTRFSQDNYSCRISWYHTWYLLTYIFSHSKRYISIHVHDLTYCNTTALHNHSEIHSMNLLFRRILDISRMHIPMYIGLFNYTSSLRNSIATRSSENMLLLWKFGFAIIVSAPYLPSQHVTSRMSIWSRTFSIVFLNTVLFINL